MLQMAVKPGVQPAIGNQLLMIALFGDTSAIEHQHSICLFNR